MFARSSQSLIHIICLRAGVGHITYSIRLGLELVAGIGKTVSFVAHRLESLHALDFYFTDFSFHHFFLFFKFASLSLPPSLCLPLSLSRWNFLSSSMGRWCIIIVVRFTKRPHSPRGSLRCLIRYWYTMYFALFRKQIALNRIEFVGGHRFRKHCRKTLTSDIE